MSGVQVLCYDRCTNGVVRYVNGRHGRLTGKEAEGQGMVDRKERE